MGLLDDIEKSSEQRAETKRAKRFSSDKLFSLGSKDKVYSDLARLVNGDNDNFFINVPIAHSAIIKPFERALGAGVRFETNNDKLQQRLALYNAELWLKRLYKATIFDENSSLVYQDDQFSIVSLAYAKRINWPSMQLKNVSPPSHCLKELCAQVKIIDGLLFDMALSGSRMFLKFDNAEQVADQTKVINQVSELEKKQTSSKMAILVGATPLLTSIDSSHLINAKNEIMHSIASITGVPVSVLNESEDNSSVFNGTGESFERYKAHLKYIQDSILFYAYQDFIDLINSTGKIESFGNFTMVSPLEVNQIDKFELYKKEVELAIDVDSYLRALGSINDIERKEFERELMQIKEKYI